MGERNRVDIEIGGIRQTFQTDADAVYLKRLAAEVNDRVHRVQDRAPHVTSAQVLALVALELADELQETTQRLTQLRSSTRTTVEKAIARIDSTLATEALPFGK